MNYNFDNKVFRVVRNDGPDAEVNEETVFSFKQTGHIVHADYTGGRVKLGKFIGILTGNEISFKYHQVNQNDEFHSGHSRDRIEITDEGKLRLIDEWEWETKQGSGYCIMEEV